MKLEFGNAEQIAKIKDLQTLKTYLVTRKREVTITESMEIEAHSEEEARNLAENEDADSWDIIDENEIFSPDITEIKLISQ
jgi:hypothetical protein